MDEARGGLSVLAFPDLVAWEAWLAAAAPDAAGLWLRLAKKDSGLPSVSRAEAVEGALCHGWIDGQAAPGDALTWLVRFTPRRRRSLWSQVNRESALALIAAGRMRPAGLAAVEAAQADGRWEAAYAPQSRAEVPPDLAAALAACPPAADAFAGLEAGGRYALLHRLQTVRTPAARAARIAGYVGQLMRGEPPLPERPQGAGRGSE